MVTGGGRGIGLGIARALGQAGFSLVITGRRGSALAAGRGLTDEGHEAYAVNADVRNPGDVQSLIEQTVARYGRLDALINNAGTNQAGGVLDLAPESFDDLFAVNVRGPYLCLRAAAPHLARSGGAVVNVGSWVARTPAPGFGIYSVTKSALVALTRAAALELAPLGITVNAVCPGNVWSDIWETATPHIRATTGKSARELYEGAVAAQPIQRGQTAEEIGATTAWLCGPAARSVTGEAIYVTGGM